jgi:hypothetical protein
VSTCLGAQTPRTALNAVDADNVGG